MTIYILQAAVQDKYTDENEDVSAAKVDTRDCRGYAISAHCEPTDFTSRSKTREFTTE